MVNGKIVNERFFSDSGAFLLFRLNLLEIDGVSGCFYLEAYKEKNTDTTSETESQPEQKGFDGFLFN